jgi:hypothetical protein
MKYKVILAKTMCVLCCFLVNVMVFYCHPPTKRNVSKQERMNNNNTVAINIHGGDYYHHSHLQLKTAYTQ